LRQTPPIGGPGGQPKFLNAAATLDTSLAPQQLLAALKQVEAALGRAPAERWAARTIDLDLLLYGNAVVDTPELVVPHPRMAFRRFVVEPAAEIAPDMLHPTIGWSMARLLDHLNAAVPYVALLGMPDSGKTALAEQLCAMLGGRFLADPTADDSLRRVARPSAGVGGRDYPRQIEYVERRAAVLDRRRWPPDGVLAISDFYFDQCLAYANLALEAAQRDAFDAAFLAVRARVVLPKLLVVLDTPRPGPAGQIPAQSDGDALAGELLGLAGRRDIGPVLHMLSAQPEVRLAEASAAIQAMQQPAAEYA
jgi:2-amino-4-hydroxy-6-hydroxymethyldihydropteridine diphosphokinase